MWTRRTFKKARGKPTEWKNELTQSELFNLEYENGIESDFQFLSREPSEAISGLPSNLFYGALELGRNMGLPIKKRGIPIHGKFAGPLFSGNKVMKEGEKLSKFQVNVKPIDRVDELSKFHDLEYSLASSIPDDKKRNLFYTLADKLYINRLDLSVDPLEVVLDAAYYSINFFSLVVLVRDLAISKWGRKITEREIEKLKNLEKILEDVESVRPEEFAEFIKGKKELETYINSQTRFRNVYSALTVKQKELDDLISSATTEIAALKQRDPLKENFFSRNIERLRKNIEELNGKVRQHFSVLNESIPQREKDIINAAQMKAEKFMTEASERLKKYGLTWPVGGVIKERVKPGSTITKKGALTIFKNRIESGDTEYYEFIEHYPQELSFVIDKLIEEGEEEDYQFIRWFIKDYPFPERLRTGKYSYTDAAVKLIEDELKKEREVSERELKSKESKVHIQEPEEIEMSESEETEIFDPDAPPIDIPEQKIKKPQAVNFADNYVTNEELGIIFELLF